MLPGLPVRVGHGELVLIGEQRGGHGVGGRAHRRRHPREGAVAVGVGARGRRRRRRHPGVPSRAGFWRTGRWLRLGFAWLEGAGEAAPGGDRKEGGGRKTTGDRKEADAEAEMAGAGTEFGSFAGSRTVFICWNGIVCRLVGLHQGKEANYNDALVVVGRQLVTTV